MTGEQKAGGHLTALFTIFIWGTTFISTKVLLREFQPVEILFFRFLIGYAALWLAVPHRLKAMGAKRELTFMAAGFCGVTLYFLLENFALTSTLAANVGVIISIAPFFTALLDFIFLKGEKPGGRFFAGFALAMAGIALISFRGGDSVRFNPTGDLLAVGAAFVWAVYSVLTRKIGGFGCGTIKATRRTFFYGLLLMIPALFFFDFKLDLIRFAHAVNLANIVYLGLGASALCFVTWSFAVRMLGAVRTSVYIYMVPVVTVIFSALILGERLTPAAVCGVGLTLAGLFLSESGRAGKKAGVVGEEAV